MSIADLNSLEINTFCEGRKAALAGLPLNEDADEIWKAGYGWGVHDATLRRHPELTIVREPGWDPEAKHHRST